MNCNRPTPETYLATLAPETRERLADMDPEEVTYIVENGVHNMKRCMQSPPPHAEQWTEQWYEGEV